MICELLTGIVLLCGGVDAGGQVDPAPIVFVTADEQTTPVELLPSLEPKADGYLVPPVPDEPTEVLTSTQSSGTIVLDGIARRIADCESGNRLASGRAEPGSYGTNLLNTSGPDGTPISTASGLFHFLDGTWQWVNAEIGGTQYSRALHAPEHKQYEAFMWLYDEGRGAHHWNASKSCWG